MSSLACRGRAAVGLYALTLASGLAFAAACSTSPPAPTLTTTELMDPQQCQACHPQAFADWSGSMHAQASRDPIFLAMNARAQRETSGAVGDFCVQCHAPMAVRTKATTDGTNLATVPAYLQGVTCYFCHSAAAVTGTHDDPITLATDGVLRAAISDPLPNPAHHAGYQALLDRESATASASLCGSCHDVVNALGTHLERTYTEWQSTIFSHAPVSLACGECHMNGSEGLAAEYPGAPLRTVHSHQFPGVDLALGDAPEAAAQQTAVQALLDTTLQAALCVEGVPGEANVFVVLDNVGSGHSFPSGTTQDRRAFVEVVAYSNDQVIYQSGVIADGASITSLADPDLWLIRDCLFDGQENQVNMFWQAASYESNQLPGSTTNVQTDPSYYLTHLVRRYPQVTSTPAQLTTLPDRVTLRVRVVPVGLDVLDDLIDGGDLDAAVKAEMQTLSLAGATLEWTEASASIKYLDPDTQLPVLCVSSGLTAATQSANPAPGHMNCKP